MSDASQAASVSLLELQRSAQQQVAHAWMSRAFIRHSAEFEDYPELNDIARAIFDIARALDTRLEEPGGYFRMLGKKLGKFRKEVATYAAALSHISEHTNFLMSAASLQATADALQIILERSRQLATVTDPNPPEDDYQLYQTVEDANFAPLQRQGVVPK
jgi:hypothetical protein